MNSDFSCEFIVRVSWLYLTLDLGNRLTQKNLEVKDGQGVVLELRKSQTKVMERCKLTESVNAAAFKSSCFKLLAKLNFLSRCLSAGHMV